MQRAIELSELAYLSRKGLPIGCVIVKNGKIIGEGHNEIFFRKNPTSHAEMVAIENACKQIDDLQLENCEMYTTLEPCPMCLGAIYWAKLKIVFFANTVAKSLEAGFNDQFIFKELLTAPKKRQIPMIQFEDENATKILMEWKAKGNDNSQPWKS